MVSVLTCSFSWYCLRTDQLVYRRATQTTETDIAMKNNMVKGEKLNYKMVQNGCYGRLLTIISWAP